MATNVVQPCAQSIAKSMPTQNRCQAKAWLAAVGAGGRSGSAQVTNAPLFQFKKVPEQVPKVAAPASAGRTFEAISFLLVSTSAYHIQVRP